MTTHKLIPSAVVCVPASQAGDYLNRCANRVILHPDSVKGLTPKLNWIFDHLLDDEAIVFVDDDIASVQRCFTVPGEESTVRNPEVIEAIIRTTFLQARDLGAYFFGWEASNGALRYYTGLKPFSLTGYINGCAMGFRTSHGLRFDERIVAKNDYDISAQNAHRHRICFKNLRYTFCQKATFTGKGGQAAFRTSATEKKDVALLQKKWGDIFRFGGLSGTRKRDYAGAVKITMHLPF